MKNNNNYNVAIVSRNSNAVSETFIKAHKELIKNSIYYYDGHIPKYSEIEGKLINDNKFTKLFFKVLEHYISPFYNIYSYAFHNSLKKNNVKVVLAEYGVVGADLIPILKKLGIKLIVHFHGFDASNKNILNAYKNKYKKMFEYASYIIVVSNIMKQKLINLGCPEHKLILNPYGPNDKFFELEPKYVNKQFFAVGRFVEKKAPYYTILAFSKVLKKHYDAKLIMAGDGPLQSICKNLVRALNIQNNVIFIGSLVHEEVINYMKNSFAFVQHSITAENGDMEGCPVGILEASAAGLPVVSTYHAGIPDVIQHEKTGFLVEEHDVAGMAEYMLNLLDNKDLAKKLGQAAKIRIKSNFTMNKHISCIETLIKKALKNE